MTSRSTGYSKDRHIFQLNDESVVVTYQTGSGVEAKYSSNGYDSWVDLSGNPGETNITSDVTTEWSGVIDANNNIHIVYANVSDDIKYRKLTYSAGTWTVGSEVTVNTGTGAFPSITITLGGTIYVAWREDGTYHDIQVKSSTDGSTWSSASTISTTIDSNEKYPVIVSNNSGDLVCAWSDSTTDYIWTSEKPNGGSWSTASSRFTGTYGVDTAGITLASDGVDFHLGWLEWGTTAQFRNRITYAKYTTSTTSWGSTEEALAQSSAGGITPDAYQTLFDPTITIDYTSDITFYVTYYADSTNEYSIARISRGASGWDIRDGYITINDKENNHYANVPENSGKITPLSWTTGTNPYQLGYFADASDEYTEVDALYLIQGYFKAKIDNTDLTRFGISFVAPASKTVSQIRVYFDVTGSPGTVTCELRTATSDDTHRPTSTILSSGTTTGAAGWNVFNITNQSITAGTWYNIVIRAASANTSNYIEVRDAEPQHVLDGRVWGVGAGGTDPDDYIVSVHSQARFVLDFTDASYWGYSYHEGQGDNVYSNGWWIGQKWTQSGDQFIYGFSLYILGVTGTPADGLDFGLYESTSEIATGELVAVADVKNNAAWYTYYFNEPILLSDATDYRLYFKSPNSVNAANSWKMSYPLNTDAAPYNTTSWGGTSSSVTYSTNQGTGWTELTSMDMPIRLLLSSGLQFSDNQARGNIITTYYCGHTYDWNIDGSNRGKQ